MLSDMFASVKSNDMASFKGFLDEDAKELDGEVSAIQLSLIHIFPGPAPVRTIARAYVYALYLFFDFAGYSLMAVGASYCFGIATPDVYKRQS